ncbi:hypothetical protein CRE_22616 [Caenorhabditis remanei]|uniref:F-box domain-containing protein n=1 Tax=Caenorhabditis remanei TaxID=31234 RepID=E3N8R2_CAERE|nr:hypothetical protein CRE_22616 [Caenorhabditis remanei]
MPNGLSYPGLKCVLEFLEANKRIHVSSRCRRLKNIERCVPLYLNTLHFRPNVVKLNEITYEIEEREEEISNHPDIELNYVDILLGPDSPFYSRMYPLIEFSNEANTFVERRVQENDTDEIKDYVVHRKVIEGLMGGRKNIRVDKLVFEQCHSTILRLPSNFKVRINKLDSGDVNPEYLLPLIDSSSFPLKKLRLIFPETLDQPIVQSSEKLFILVTEDASREYLNDIFELPNRSVITEFTSLNEDTYSNIIDFWLNNKQVTGKCFIINGNKPRMTEAAIDLMKKYNGKMVKWNGTEFRSNSNTNYISIPLNDDFVIGIYAISHESWNHQIVMKPMRIDSFIPAEDFSEVKTLLEMKAPKNPRLIEELAFCVVALISLAIILFIPVSCLLIILKFAPSSTQN